MAMAVMAVGVSSAMAFLERKRVIHRDIAARNILVGVRCHVARALPRVLPPVCFC